MPTLNWIGKEAVVNHHHEVPFHLLKDVPELGGGPAGSGNLIVEGDNLVALKALLPYYRGKVKCICIDPPYNTGNEGWAYNDNVKSPAIKKWLGEVVGKEGETLDRHDRWLCMMYPRLALLKEFLSEDGSIFVFLDDNEIHSLRYAMDEVFGEQNFVGQIVWQHSIQGKNDAKTISLHHNYVVVYSRTSEFQIGKIPREDKHNKHYANPDEDPKGPWRSGDVRSPNYRENLCYEVKTPSGNVITPPAKGWRWEKTTFAEKVATGEIIFVKNDTRVLRKIYLNAQGGRVPESIWFGEECGTTREASQVLKDLFGSLPFQTPKPPKVIERILQIATNPGDLVLDSFAGSGTTGHAVLKMNTANPEAAPRRFILVEMEEKIAREITRERVKRVAEGYTNAKGENVAGLGGGFRYVTLGESLFDEHGRIRESVRFGELARHVYFCETGEPLPVEQVTGKSPLLGVHRGRAVHLLYNGILKDRSIGGGNALCRETLRVILEWNAASEGIGETVVYGTSQRLAPAVLKRHGIIFKQIPYNIRIS